MELNEEPLPERLQAARRLQEGRCAAGQDAHAAGEPLASAYGLPTLPWLVPMPAAQDLVVHE